MTNLTDFIKFELYPRLFDRIDEAFPRMGFEPYRGGWASPCKMDGNRSHDGRKDKSVVTQAVPTRVYEQGFGSKDLIDFYKEQNGITETIEAVKQLSSICGLQLPPMEGEKAYQLRKEMQDKLEALDVKMREALFTDECRGTLDYLKGRGYTEDFIKWAGFGSVSPSIREELRQTLPMCHHDIGITHFLSLPYRTGGKIQGFVFRVTSATETPGKYLDAFITKTASKKYNLFGLTGLRLTGDKERDRDITIVEGEIDALRAIYAGLPNVVAASGGAVYKEALAEAKKRGVKRVTLLFDYDIPKREGESIEQKQEETAKKIEKALTTIQEAGLTPFVATFPTDGDKMDVDSYLRNHTGQQLTEIVETAASASLWMKQRLIIRATEGKPEGLTEKELHELKGQIIDLCNKPYTSPTDRDIILRDFNQATGDYITKSALLEEADKEKAAQEALRQRQETIDLAAKISSLANDGRTAEALSMMEGRVKELQQISREAEYNELLRLPTVEAIKDSFKQRPSEVPTGYVFERYNGKETEKEELKLQTGALTYICAPTSHGKSRMLENLALNLATDGKAGDVLYFSFEEDSVAIQEQLLNIYANMPLSRNNTRSLRAYLKSGTIQYFSPGVSVAELQRKEAELYSILTTGRLRVYYRDYGSAELMDAIRHFAKSRKIKAVFVDYIQLLHTKGTRLQRREELGEMCKSLWGLAIELSIPIVLAAQLNRETSSPLDMASQNIAEAADIERSANTIILLWNSYFKPSAKDNSYYRTSKGEPTLTNEAKRLDERGFHIGTGGKIYAKISKNRGGSPNMDAILDFNGNTGKIETNLDGLPFEDRPQPRQDEPLTPF